MRKKSLTEAFVLSQTKNPQKQPQTKHDRPQNTKNNPQKLNFNLRLLDFISKSLSKAFEHPQKEKNKMKPKHIILITALLTTALIAFAFAAPATADTITQIDNAVAEIINNDELSPAEKLEEQTKVFGMDLRLKMWLEAPRDEETGEPIYDDYIPVITPVLSFLGLTEAIENPYTQEEGEAAYAAYLDIYLSSYRACGEFGGPIE